MPGGRDDRRVRGLPDPARRHGRVLRLGDAARPSRAPGRAGRGRWRSPRRGAGGELPGPAVRRPVRDVGCRRAQALPAGGPAGARVPAVRGRLALGDGDVPAGHARWSRRTRWTRRSSTSPAPARQLGTPLQVAERLRARIFDEQRITCSVGLAGTVSVAKLASRDGPSRTASWCCRPSRSSTTCTRSTSASCSGSARRPGPEAAQARSAHRRRHRRDRAADLEADARPGLRASTCTSWPGRPTGAR